VGAVVVLDRITKIIAEQSLLTGPVSVIGDAVQFRLIYNRGAAFGLGHALGPSVRWVFLVIAIIAIVVLARMAREAAITDHLRQWSLGLVAGGAAGNLIDRIIRCGRFHRCRRGRLALAHLQCRRYRDFLRRRGAGPLDLARGCRAPRRSVELSRCPAAGCVSLSRLAPPSGSIVSSPTNSHFPVPRRPGWWPPVR
ncbi:MAG TPA: signal peptidase II, partial [Gemmatimonadales bacterium]|nr:signal peptidase II [Gemmatimonadales bacterium]